MNKIAIIFSNAPYGNNLGNEGLNIALSITCYTESIGFFFIGDGVLQLLDHQKPDQILSKSYFNSFKMLNIHNMGNFYVCYDSLLQRGLNKKRFHDLNLNIFNFTRMRHQILQFDVLLNF